MYPLRPQDDRVKTIKEKKMIYFIHIFQNKIKYFLMLMALLLNTCDATSIKNLPATNIQEYIDANNNMDIEIIDENSNTTTLKKLHSIAIVIFVATWCPSCPSVLKKFDDLLNKIIEKKIKNIKIIALNIGDEDIDSLKIHYKANNIQLLDVYQSVDHSVTNGIRGIPTCLIFNENGKLVWGYSGGRVDFSSDEFLNSLESIRKTSPYNN